MGACISPQSCSKIRGLPTSPTRFDCSTNFITRHHTSVRKAFRPRSEFQNAYDTTDLIGSGAHAQVQKAVHKLTGERCAVKQLAKPVGFESKTYHNLSGFLRSLNHQNVLKHWNFYEDKQNCLILTELCSSQTLLSLADEEITEAELAPLMKQVFSALAYCHTLGLVHRDVKPENLLLEQGCVKLADFGCSARTTSVVEGVVGSPYYMAPEVLKGNYSVECDLWSCGIMMYMLLTRKTPYRARTVQEVLEAVKERPFQPTDTQMRTLSDSARSLLLQLLEIDPARRISASEALEHPWICHT